jgi:hypothetical protein
VTEGSGGDTHRTGTVIDRKLIPVNHRGVPTLGQGHYNAMTKDEIALIMIG